MPASSGPGPRPISPVEEDLQKLYNEVWAVFAEETPASERDLDNIYSGYADDNNDLVPQSLAHQPSQKTPRSVSPYPVITQNIAAPASPVSSKSPTRRRLPPTPGGSSSSSIPSVASFAMPEPEPYYSPGASRTHMYSPSALYASFGSSSPRSSDPAPNTRRVSDSDGRQLPNALAHSSYVPTWDDGDRTPVSITQAYASRSASGSHHRPTAALPPALPPKPSAYINMAQYPYSSASSSTPYAEEDQDVYDYASKADSYRNPTPPPPPPPHPVAENDQYVTYPSQNPYTTPQEAISYGGFTDFSLRNTTGAVSQNSFFDQPSSSTQLPQHGAHVQAGLDSNGYDYDEQDGHDDDQDAFNTSDANVMRRPSDMLHSLANFSPNKQPSLDLHENPLDDYWEDEDEEDETRFVNLSLLSHIAMQLRDKVPRGTHVKGNIPHPRAFTGKDIVSTIQTQIQRELAINHGVSTNDRRVALQVARSLQSQLCFYEVEWNSRVLQDGVEDVYMFLDDLEGGSDAIPEREELPTGVITMLTRCYSPSCGEGVVCYSYSCPRKGDHAFVPPPVETVTVTAEEAWSSTVDASVLKNLPQSEINRQNIIFQLINREKQYLQDLDLVESSFIKPLRAANPPVLPPHILEDFIDDVFGNILDLRETNRRLLEVLYVRQREENPVILRIGDIFLQAAAEFRFAYPTYIGHFPISEKRLKEEMDANPKLTAFLDQCSRNQTGRSEDSTRLELKSFLSRPADHLQKYTVHLETVLHETEAGNPDIDYLVEAIDAIKNLHAISQLRTFQSAMGKGAPGKWEWHDIVSADVREHFTKQEAKRQAVIFELIKGEMAYVKDLENIQNMYIIPLRKAEPPIIPPERLDQFIDEVFHNYAELFQHHKKLVDNLHEIQREQHPEIQSITAPLFDAALNFRDSYMEYIPNYPIAAYRIDSEMANNPAFKKFVDACVRHPDAHRLDMKSFINRPIPRLLRYELLLKSIMDETPPGHEDLESIPNVIEVIKALGKETEPGVTSAKQKVEVWRYSANLTFKPGESIDMDLLDPNRSLVYSGKLLRQPESGLEWNGWSELHVLLFDNYLVMTKPKDKDGVIEYRVNRRPIPLDLLTLVNFTDPPTQRSAGILRNLRGGERHDSSNSANPGLTPDSASDSRSVFPLTLHHNGRTGGPYILYAESAQSRAEWKKNLEHALVIRKTVQESNKVFEVEYLSRDTFIMPAVAVGTNNSPAWNQDSQFTGKVTCSVPFNPPDGRALVAIGSSEGVWIGYRHDPKSIRRVLHLKMVTQCAMLEDFGIFLVLADKALFAYHIEALVPSSPHGAHTSQVPQKLSGTKDVHFFSVGTLQGRTLIIYMKKKSLNSIFRVLEPVGDKINEGVKAPAGFGSRLGFRSTKSEWFRIYRDFFLPSDSFDVIFLKARIAIFCAKGFEIMNLHDFESQTIPHREDPRHAQLAKRCESARPLGMFRSSEEEFLLCYDEFGLYVDKHGDPCRSSGTIEWEGTAERVAFHKPYILLFDSRFIEVRHIATGRLAQIIPGNEIRCTWDGRGVSANASTIDSGDDDVVQEAQVHFVMNSTDSVTGPGGMRTRNIVQHVCELIPTVALFPPTIASPSSTSAPIPPAKSQPQYNPYNPSQSHMSTHSYASSTHSTAQPHYNAMGHSYTPSIAPNDVNPIPGGGSYYDRTGQSMMAPPRSPELRTSQTWR